MASAKTARSASRYDVHPGVAMMEKWVAELKGKSGRSVEEWIMFVKKEGPKDEKSRREWLKSKGINHADIETPGMHTWMVWRRNLTEFAALLFR